MIFVPGRMKSRFGLNNLSKLPNEITCRKHGATEATRLVWLASAVLRQQYTNTPHIPIGSLQFILIILTFQPFSLKYRLAQRDRGMVGIRLSCVVRATHRSQKAHTITYTAIRGLAQVLSIHLTLYPKICFGPTS